MRVGDRVRCIEGAYQDRFGVLDRIYTVSFVSPTHIQCRELGGGRLTPRRFEVVRDEVAPPQAEQGLVIYTVVFKSRVSLLPVSNGYSTEQEAIARKRELERQNFTILGMKKITLRGMGA